MVLKQQRDIPENFQHCNLLHSAVTVYQIHKDYEKKWWKNTHLSESNTHAERLKFITANIETNPDQE